MTESTRERRGYNERAKARTTNFFGMEMSPQERERLDYLAYSNNMSRGELIRYFIRNITADHTLEDRPPFRFLLPNEKDTGFAWYQEQMAVSAAKKAEYQLKRLADRSKYR